MVMFGHIQHLGLEAGMVRSPTGIAIEFWKVREKCGEFFAGPATRAAVTEQ